jgi:hypothetical protein
MNETKILQLKNEIEKLPGDINGYHNDTADIPKVFLQSNPLIDTLIKSLRLKDFSFTDIFVNKDMRTFIPYELELIPIMQEYVLENPAFIFHNKFGKKFLAYCGKVMQPEYVWELVDAEKPEEAPASAEAGAEGEGEAAPAEGEEGLF